VGLFNAGKTTLVKQLKLENKSTEIVDEKYQPTMGLSMEIFKLGDLEVIAADLGGQASFQESFWKPFVSKSASVVFVFDSADLNRVNEAGEALKKVLKWIPSNCSFLFLANKMDLDNALKLEEIIERLKLKDQIKERPHSFGVYQVSALKGINLQEPINWLIDQITKINKTRGKESTTQEASE
jgi:small GTP-binding protein